MSLLGNIGNILAKPTTLEEQRLGQAFFAEEHTSPITNEADLLSLMTLREFYNEDERGKAALKAIGQEESIYLVAAMKI